MAAGSIVILMKFGDNMKGQSTYKGYEDWIQLDSVDFGATRTVSQESGVSNRTVGTPVISKIAATKKMCPASAKLFLETLGGTAKECKIHILSGSDGTQLNLVSEYTLRNSLIANHSSNATTGQPSVTENITICFDAINGVYTPYNAQGVKSAPFAYGYDVSKGTKT